MSNLESPNNSHMLFVGQQCHASQCYLVDFLPFKCDHCRHSHCAQHFKPEDHACEKFDPSKHNRVAPSCPLCDTPVAIPPNEDPNIRMERHIQMECQVATGRKTKINSAPVCAKSHCGKKLLAPIKCPDCKQQFCATHRHSSSHNCTKSPTGFKSSPATNPLSKAKSAISSSVSTAGITSGMDKTMKAAQAILTPPAGSSTSKTNLGSSFKADRRAKAEQESQLRAMRERAEKGLLSDKEKVQLAELEAVAANRKNECLLM